MVDPFEKIGALKNYWHVIALVSEIKRGSSIKRELYGHRFLIWRDQAGVFHALTDCCAHKKAPLEVADFNQNKIVCPYHGWEYDQNGTLTNIPSSPSCCEKLKCKVGDFLVCEKYDFVWIYLGDPKLPKNGIPDLARFDSWSKCFLKKEFQTSEDLLIDNFMDPTHTGLVHDGLIRSSQNSCEHCVKVTTSELGVLVDFEEQTEAVGLGMRFLFGKEMRVKHTDEFLFPNLVRVIYAINGVERFVALIACSPNEKLNGPSTTAFVQLRYNFGWSTPLVSPFVKGLAGKVFKQDFEITQKQSENRDQFPDLKENLIAADVVASQVAKLRRKFVAGDCQIRETVQEFKLRF
ncbi:MAG: Rieske 2Fe-2S domain-containing protein [Mariniblastus sp.]